MPARPKNLDHLPEPARRLAERLVSFGKRLGLNQEGLEEKIGVDQSTISRWQNGKLQPDVPAYGRLMKLARKAGLEEYREFFLSQVERILDEAEIPAEELRERRRMKKGA